MQVLPQVYCILCECKNAGNIGAAARAIKNMGLNGLILVKPSEELWLEGMKMAPGALDVLENAIIFDSIEDAVSGMHLVVGTTRRSRKHRTVTYSPREVFSDLVNLSPDHKIALVFGSEKTGLTNHELSFCQKIVVIPTSPDQPSINLAQAVMIVAYEWHMACVMREGDFLVDEAVKGHKHTEYTETMNLSNGKERQRLIEHTERLLEHVNFLKENKDHIMLTLIDMLFRVNPTKREIAILRGILKNIEDSLM